MSQTFSNSFKTQRWAFILALAIVTMASPNITFAPPPQVNVSTVLQLSNSTIGAKFIGSKRLESLQLSSDKGSTAFSLSFFNRSANSNVNQYTVRMAGSWTYLGGTQETLSCSLVYETSTETFGLMQFLNNIGSFKLFTNISLA